jgi:hypothetical protein
MPRTGFAMDNYIDCFRIDKDFYRESGEVLSVSHE